MRILCFILVLLAISGCGSGITTNDTECAHGSITGIMLSKAAVDSSALPSDFKYTAAEFRDAILGTWIDSAKDVTLSLTQAPSTTIDYNVSREGFKCGGTETSMLLVGDLTTNGSQPSSASGMFVAGASLDSARLNIRIGTQSCSFTYSTLSEKGEAQLESNGVCNLSAMGLGNGETLALIKLQ